MRQRTSHKPWPRCLSSQGMLVLYLALVFLLIGYRPQAAAVNLTTTTVRLTVDVSGLSGTITNVSVTLTNLSTQFGDDVDILLVHPNGSNNLVFWSDSTTGAADNLNGTFILADSASTCLPNASATSVPSGSYKPATYGTVETVNSFNNLSTTHPGLTLTFAGSGCTGTSGSASFASAFGGLTADGTWELWVELDVGGATGTLQKWSLTITTTTGSATVANVESFTAMPSVDGSTQLAWRTGFEVDNLGFNVYRDDNGQRTKLNPSVIAGSALLIGPGMALTAGRSYVWWDTSAAATPDTQYWLEDIDLNGQRTWHGPAAIDWSAQAGGPLLPAGRGQAALLGNLGRATTDKPRLSVPTTRRATLSTQSVGLSIRRRSLAERSAVKLSIQQAGWYRVTQAELVAAGLKPAVDPRLLHVYVDGHEIPILITGQSDGRFDQGDTLEFYGLGLDEPWTDSRVYWLVAGARPGQRIAHVSALGGQPAGNSFPYTVERKDRTVYFSSLRNGERENFFGAVVSSESIVETLLVSHLDATPAGTPQLEVALQGVTSGAHRVLVTLNGVSIGEVDFQDQNARVASFPVASSLLHAGHNEVELTAQAGDSDISLVDAIRLTYWHTYTADNDVLQLSATGQQRVTIGGFSGAGIRVLDVTDPDAVREVNGLVNSQGSEFAVTLTVPGSGPKTLLALTPGQAKPVAGMTTNEPSHWHQSGLGADLMIIGYRDFVGTIEPLKALRQGQGLQVAVVDVEDLYDEFSDGHKTPYAVQDFLTYATEQWSPAPRYVLFVGHASLDPRNYLGFGDSDLVPTKLIDTQRMETASDDWFADRGGDGLPEVAVGRLPVGTTQEAERVVAKILRYEASGGGSGVLLVSGANDGFDFEAANDQLRELLPVDLTVAEIKREQLDADTATSQLIASLNRGPALVNYVGHGSVDLWGGSLLTADDARALNNSEELSVYIAMTCLNGYFHGPGLEGLAQALLSAERGGAVAVWAPSGMTEPGGQAIVNQELFRLLFTESDPNGAPLTLGEAARRAKGASSDDDIRRTWILMGDPTMKLRIR